MNFSDYIQGMKEALFGSPESINNTINTDEQIISTATKQIMAGSHQNPFIVTEKIVSGFSSDGIAFERHQLTAECRNCKKETPLEKITTQGHCFACEAKSLTLKILGIGLLCVIFYQAIITILVIGGIIKLWWSSRGGSRGKQ